MHKGRANGLNQQCSNHEFFTFPNYHLTSLSLPLSPSFIPPPLSLSVGPFPFSHFILTIYHMHALNIIISLSLRLMPTLSTHPLFHNFNSFSLLLMPLLSLSFSLSVSRSFSASLSDSFSTSLSLPLSFSASLPFSEP